MNDHEIRMNKPMMKNALKIIDDVEAEIGIPEMTPPYLMELEIKLYKRAFYEGMVFSAGIEEMILPNGERIKKGDFF